MFSNCSIVNIFCILIYSTISTTTTTTITTTMICTFGQHGFHELVAIRSGLGFVDRLDALPVNQPIASNH